MLIYVCVKMITQNNQKALQFDKNTRKNSKYKFILELELALDT